MKQLLGFLTIAALVGFAFTNPVKEAVEAYTVDVKESKVNWKAYKVTGEHWGFVNLKSGELEYTDGKLTGGNFVINMTSITVTDLEGDGKGKLEGHLKSADFFGIEEHPTAAFEITKVTPQGPGRYKVEGDLTIKKITKPIKFTAVVEEGADAVTATADIKVDRSEYNVRYGSGSFFENLGDKTIYDEFDLTVSLKASKVNN